MDIKKLCINKYARLGRKLKCYKYNKETDIVSALPEPTKFEIERGMLGPCLIFKVGAVHHCEIEVTFNE